MSLPLQQPPKQIDLTQQRVLVRTGGYLQTLFACVVALFVKSIKETPFAPSKPTEPIYAATLAYQPAPA